METKFILEVKNLSKSFPGVKALDNVSLQVRKGTVHALMGENGAGKSTLMKCIFGIYSPDAGEIYLNGQKVRFQNARQALDSGISMIQQELQPVRYRSVMENIWLGRYPEIGFGPFKIVDNKKMREETELLLKTLKIDLDPAVWVKNLSASQIQSMEIATAVSYNAKIIFMDEPTSSLTENEVEHLFTIINQLKEDGVAIIYVSHKMDEILKIADDVSIMRDGQFMGTYPAGELDVDKIITKMVGRQMTQLFPPRHKNISNETALKVEHFTAKNGHSFADVSFDLKKGELLGIGGLVGAQRTELVEALFGLRPLQSGSISINGQQVVIKSPLQAKKYGMALLTEERRATGIFPILSVSDNTVMANLSAYARMGLLNKKNIAHDVKEKVSDLHVKTPTVQTMIKNLSGGNQQKVLLGRWLLTEPSILILDEPTRGIDVGAKYEIYELINTLLSHGKSIIMISSEMPELLGMTDRIMVMCEGRVTAFLKTEEANQEMIMHYATQFL